MVLFIEILLIGVGLSMDAFAVSICKGLGMTKVNRNQALTIGLYFGGFQALMPFIGYMLGIRFEKYITSIDHWIAFILLGFIGGKMVYEAVKERMMTRSWKRPGAQSGRDASACNCDKHRCACSRNHVCIYL